MGGPPPLEGSVVQLLGAILIAWGAIGCRYPHRIGKLLTDYQRHRRPADTWDVLVAFSSSAGAAGTGVGLVVGARLVPEWALLLALFLGFASFGLGLWLAVFYDFDRPRLEERGSAD